MTSLSYVITIGTILYYYCTVLVARPTEKKVRQTLLLPSAANWSLRRRPPRLDRPEAVAWCRLPSAVAGVCASADLCDTMLVLFFAQGVKAYFAWVVFSRPLRKSFLNSRYHANILRWCCRMSKLRLHNRFIYVGVDISIYALLTGGWSLYLPG